MSAGVSATIVARVIDAHTPTGSEPNITCWCGERFESWAEHAMHVAPLILASLDLTEETRELADGMGGMTVSGLGKVTTYSRPCTRQRRWVSSWTSGSAE
jgi:hypothetical protein